MMKAIAIDDEPVALEVIKSLSAKIPFIDLTAVFTNAFHAIPVLQGEPIDLLFLDIRMPDISGIDFLQSISSPPMVIFTTAYSEHAVQSFELDAIDYLLKPFSSSRFLKACNKAYEQYRLRKSNQPAVAVTGFIFIKNGYEEVRVDLDDILYVESNGNYMQFVLSHSKLLSRLTMKEVEEMLPSHDFVRIHRSYIAARKKIHKIDKSTVWIRDAALPVGAGYAHEMQKIKKQS
jgi:two-component system LytT family response regulator